MKKIAKKMADQLKNMNKAGIVDRLDVMAFIMWLIGAIVVGTAVIIVIVVRFHGLTLCSPLTTIKEIICTIPAAIITETIYTAIEIRFIKELVNQYNDIKDLKYFDSCSDYMNDSCIKDYLKQEIEKKHEKIAIVKETAEQKPEEKISLDLTLKKRQNQFNAAKKILDKFNYESLNIPGNVYEKILADVDLLKTILKDNPDGYAFVETTFSVYTDEFISLLKSMTVKERLSDKDENRIEELVRAFDNYIVRTIKKIKEQNQVNIDISYDVVMRNLTNTNV